MAEKKHIKTIKNVFNIIEFIRNNGGVSSTSVAEEIGLARSTTHYYLSTMEDLGYLVKKDDTYYLSLEYLGFGNTRRNQIVPRKIILPTLELLAEETSETVWFSVEENNYLYNLYKSAGERSISLETPVGQRLPINAFAAGKAILSCMSEEQAMEAIEACSFPQLTDKTITNPKKFFDEIEKIDQNGVAYDDEEHTKGLRSVAAPVTTEASVIGAITVSGPANRFRGDRFTEKIPDLVLGAANEIELRLKQ